MKTIWICVTCGDDKIGRSIQGMQYINDDYYNEIFKTGEWDCRFCGETKIKKYQRTNLWRLNNGRI